MLAGLRPSPPKQPVNNSAWRHFPAMIWPRCRTNQTPVRSTNC